MDVQATADSQLFVAQPRLAVAPAAPAAIPALLVGQAEQEEAPEPPRAGPSAGAEAFHLAQGVRPEEVEVDRQAIHLGRLAQSQNTRLRHAVKQVLEPSSSGHECVTSRV